MYDKEDIRRIMRKIEDKTFKEIIKEMSKSVQEEVHEIETSIETSECHYGRYLNILTDIEGASERVICALILVEAGANKDSVHAAMKILYKD